MKCSIDVNDRRAFVGDTEIDDSQKATISPSASNSLFFTLSEKLPYSM
jgi:hypothetical protein